MCGAALVQSLASLTLRLPSCKPHFMIFIWPGLWGTLREPDYGRWEGHRGGEGETPQGVKIAAVTG